MFKHLMLDIETMGNESFSSIVSIGALEFDIESGAIGKEFYCTIDLQSCIDAGLIMNASTVMWWMQQSDNARNALISDSPVALYNALSLFSSFCTKEYEIWGNSARFDCGILQNAYNKIGAEIPWDFRKERCVRTLVSMNPSVKENYEWIGVGHHALSDCYNQVAYCHKTWTSLHASLNS